MSKSYNPYEHTFVVIRHGGLDTCPRQIVHHVPSPLAAVAARVWTGANHVEELPPGAVVVGDGLTNGFDQDGNLIISIPSSWCSFHTDEEAQTIIECIEADDRLLSNAR
jgi:hypothetical protein